MSDRPERIGETITFRSQKFRIDYIKPCQEDKTLKMAEIQIHTKKRLTSTAAKKFTGAEVYKDAGVVKLREGRKEIVIFDSGRIRITSAESNEDIFETAKRLAEAML